MQDKIKELEERIESLKNAQLKAVTILEQFDDMVKKQQRVIERIVSIMEDLASIGRKKKNEIPRYIG
ncbi:MAG: hypothetical protein ACE5KD_00925 [Candidatus Bathyarchaeia archaeon]